MDDVWLKFDAVSFEELAIEYANAVFPEWKWIQTQPTRDGGKDGTATIFDRQTKIGQIKKEAWVEAKYTKNYRHAIPLSRIASTVLIGHNKRDLVEILLIVTNASFNENTIHEIHMVFGNRVIFVSGRDLLLWMQDNNQCNTQDEADLFYVIGKPLTIKQDILCQSISTYSGQLILGEKYDLFITLNVSILSKTKLQFKIAEHSDYIAIHDDLTIDTNIGTNFISIPFTTLKAGKITKTHSFLTLKEINTSALIDIRLDRNIQYNPRIEILCQSQNESCQMLLQNYDLFHNIDKGVFFNLIEGAAGQGKSHILTDFIQSQQNDEYIFIKFNKDNEFSNSVLLIRLLIFIVWGRFFSENILFEDDSEELNEEIHRLQQICEYNKDYTEYLRYMADRDNAFEIINTLCYRKDLIPQTSNTTEKIIILDDLQFLGIHTSRFLLHLLEQETLSEYKIFCVIAKRNGTLVHAQLDDFIKTCSSQQPFMVQLSDSDIRNSLYYNELKNFPDSIYPKLNKNILILKEFIATAKVLRDKHPIMLLKDDRIKRLLTEPRHMPFIYGKFSAESKKIIDIVYFFKSGVDALYLYSRYSETAIDELVYKDVIKNSPSGYVPYHDLLWESISALIKYDSKHIYDYAVYKLQNEGVVEYFSVLGFFPSKFDQKKEDFISTITTLHDKQRYANVYYILHRFFSIKHYERLLYNRYHHALLLFYYGYAIFNVGDCNGLGVFERAYTQLENTNQSEREKSLFCLILSEIANCHYWDLNFNSVIQKYNIITEIFFQKEQKNRDDWMAYFTISTRYINSLFFTDNYPKAVAVYQNTMAQVQDSEIKKLAMYLVTNYNEANFINDGAGSYTNIKEFIENYFDEMPIKNKFVIKSTYLFMGIILGYNSIYELEEWIEWGRTQSLEYNYRVAKLNLGVCYALKGEYEKVEQIIHSIIDIRDFPILVCGKYHNLEALVHLVKGRYDSALSSLDAQEKCFVQLGKTFLNNIYSNQRLIKSMPKKFNVDYKIRTPLTFCIDIRL